MGERPSASVRGPTPRYEAEGHQAYITGVCQAEERRQKRAKGPCKGDASEGHLSTPHHPLQCHKARINKN